LLGLPAVYSREEIITIHSKRRGVHRLQVELMYGAGLRKADRLSLRVKEISFGGGKGNKDRTTMLPLRLIPALKQQIGHVEQLHAQDIIDGYGKVLLYRCGQWLTLPAPALVICRKAALIVAGTTLQVWHWATHSIPQGSLTV
jgi:integrase